MMKRRGFLATSLGGVLGGGLAAAQEVKVADGSLFRTPVSLMAPRTDGITVVWAVSALCRGWVEWKGEDGSGGKADMTPAGFVPQTDEVFQVEVNGLKPGVVYAVKA